MVVRANPMAQSERFRAIHPAREIDAEFSHAHTLAMGALGVPAGPGWYAPGTLTDPAVAAFRERVSVELEPSSANLGEWIEDGQFRRIPGGVDVHARGTVLRRTVELAWGDPWSAETTFSDEALREKFERMVAGAGPGSPEASRHAARIVEGVDSLEQMDDVGELGQLLALRPATGR